MPKRLLVVALAVGVLAVACSKPPKVTVTFGSGNQFVPQVADFLDSVGLDPSIAVTSDGTPYVAYLGFPQELAAGQVAAARPIGSPSLPAVLLTSVKNGIWTRGAAAVQAAIPNVSIPFGPASVADVKTMTPQNVNGTAIAADASGGLHVVWAADTGVWYAENMGGSSFMATQIFKLTPPLTVAGPLGEPSVAVASDGTPWVAYTLTTARGQEVRVASPTGGKWKTDTLATLPLKAGGSQPYRTAVAVGAGGKPVVVFSNGRDVEAASLGAGDEGGWGSSTVESGADGYGLSLATASDGSIRVAYYAGSEVHTATSKDATSWQASTVATVSSGSNEAGRSTGIAVDGSGAVYVTWYDPGTDSVQLATATGATFSPVTVQGTEGGDRPTVTVPSDASAVYVAWYDESDQNLELGTYGSVGGLSLAVQSPTPTGAPTTAPPPTTQCTKPVNGVVNLVAQGIAFDTSCIEVPASQPFTIHFDNKDTATQHNVSIYPSSTDLTTHLFQGELVTGPATKDYDVPALKEGELYFQCDVHPTTMNGKITVTSGGGGSGGASGGGGGGGTPSAGGGVTTAVTASGLAFDVGTITLPADKAVTITFTNNDAAVQHNIAIYASSTDLATPLFRGDLLTGPGSTEYDIPALKPGTYYFQCDVHPTTMNGQVVVK